MTGLSIEQLHTDISPYKQYNYIRCTYNAKFSMPLFLYAADFEWVEQNVMCLQSVMTCLVILPSCSKIAHNFIYACNVSVFVSLSPYDKLLII